MTRSADKALGDCPNFRGATDDQHGESVPATKMGLSPSARPSRVRMAAPSGRKTGQSPVKGGFTLIEVILALAILGGAVAVISQAAWSGLENARMTQDLVQAQLLAENVTAELAAGIRPLKSSEDNPAEEDDGVEDPEHWLFSVEVASSEVEGVLDVRVTVRTSSESPRQVEYSLARWMLEPESEDEMSGDEADEE